MKTTRIIGLMSGTSLDGLDVCCVDFWEDENQKLQWKWITTKCYDYTDGWDKKLKNAHQFSAINLLQLHTDYGKYLGKKVNDFIDDFNLSNIELIASHGHTIYHQPEKGITFQLGHGAAVFAETEITTICDFRTQDVLLGGQGAPLVPVGDELLFCEFDACLNLGGFANISFRHNGKRIAFDICPVNFVLNYYAQKLGKPFDENGRWASEGSVRQDLLNKLNQLDFYQKNAHKSLGREWVENIVFPLLDEFKLSPEDALATFIQHITAQIEKVILKYPIKSILVTGGGTKNRFLLEKLNKCNIEWEIPSTQLIDYKEALVFALLGYLKINQKINVYSSVTGAKSDSCSGVIYK